MIKAVTMVEVLLANLEAHIAAVNQNMATTLICRYQDILRAATVRLIEDHGEELFPYGLAFERDAKDVSYSSRHLFYIYDQYLNWTDEEMVDFIVQKTSELMAELVAAFSYQKQILVPCLLIYCYWILDPDTSEPKLSFTTNISSISLTN